MNNSSFLCPEDFICNASFQNYCLETNMSDVLYWEVWIAQHKESIKNITEAKKIILILSCQQGGLLKQLSELQDAVTIQKELKLLLNKNDTVEKSVTQTKFISVIGTSLIILILGFLLWPKSPLMQYHTANNRQTILLPDSSLIFLNDNSTVIVDKDFNKNNRKISLVGEGYFDIHHDSLHPFYIHTTQMDVKVVGTRFNLKTTKDSFSAALYQGKIILYTDVNGPSITLKPNHQYTLASQNPVNKISLKKQENEIDTIYTYPKWSKHVLTFDALPLDNIVDELKLWYGISFVFKDEGVKKYTYTGTFEDTNVLNILSLLSESYPFNFYIKNNVVYISK